MKFSEYASYDALGLAELVARREVTPRELAALAAQAVQTLDGELRSVVETYPDRIEGLDEASLGPGPFRGVPFLMKEAFGHEKGRKIEFDSRLCRSMAGEVDSFLMTHFRAAGVNALGRSAAPEYSMAATTESLMFGNTSNPWKKGCSAGGSSGGRRCGRGGRHRADRSRFGHRRFDPHTGQLVRWCRPQAVAPAGVGRPNRG
jgi:amidase